ncbi:hypothetical protein ILYODFUR_013170 [Ilyodon furcidens]|uniref:Uncharacterized protein n=1 Tax=Ilyodon furcidens TaxID=33524 RepID=A0ABV0UTW0_9TELE
MQFLRQKHSVVTALITLKANKQRLLSTDSKPSLGYLSRTDLCVCIISKSKHSFRQATINNPKALVNAADGSLAQSLKVSWVFFSLFTIVSTWQELCMSNSWGCPDLPVQETFLAG